MLRKPQPLSHAFHSNTFKRTCNGPLRRPFRFVFKIISSNKGLSSIGGGGTATRSAETTVYPVSGGAVPL